MRHDRYERVNFERERRKIFKLYRGTQILERRQVLEQRVMQSLGFVYDYQDDFVGPDSLGI